MIICVKPLPILKSTGEDVMAVDGTYKIEINTPIGKQEATLALKTSGIKLNGTMASALGNMDFSGGSVSGDEAVWSIEINSPMGNLKLDFKGKVTGSDISGEVKAGDFGTSPFEGKKV
jgi:hypothetical protein